jgi:hypothetical protein
MTLLLSHADRNRMIDDAQRSRLLVSENLTRGALYDGRVCATWKVQRQGKKSATLEVEPINGLTARSSVEAEGRRLLTFVADPAASTEVRVLA